MRPRKKVVILATVDGQIYPTCHGDEEPGERYSFGRFTLSSGPGITMTMYGS